MYEKIEDQTLQVVETLSGKLALPSVIKIGFYDSRSCFASARKGRLNISSEFLDETIVAEANLDSFRGVVGHEISHISDYEVQRIRDRAHNLRHFVVAKIVSEGKAEHVGVDTGGKGFKKYVETLDNVQSGIVYRFLVDEGVANKRKLFLVDPYILGYKVVDDVVTAVGASDVFDIHSEKTDFFVDAIDSVLNSRAHLHYETTIR